MDLQKKPRLKRLVFAVTNDLNYDQRMMKICSSLHNNGYRVLLIGRKKSDSSPLVKCPYHQIRINCFFQKGKLFYTEYNLKLFILLLFTNFDLIGAIDLDTILPCYFTSVIKRKKRIYDAHELFCEMKEIVTRPSIYRIWKFIERKTVPHFPLGYTVTDQISNIFLKEYHINYEVIRNVPFLKERPITNNTEKFIIYQGSVNEGRSFETLIPAFKWIDCPLRIYGDGNFLSQAKNIAKTNGLENKVHFMGKLLPADLKNITSSALLGVTLFENNGLSNYYSLANRFFDYIHAVVPQLCVDFPEYKKINEEFQVAVLINDLSAESIAKSINGIINDPDRLNLLKNNCMKAAKVYNWQSEEKKLILFYRSVFLENFE